MSHPFVGYHLRQNLNLGESYPASQLDRKSALWFKSYSIFSTKFVLKPRRVDIEKNLKKTLWGIFIYIFSSQDRKSDLWNRKCEKNDIQIAQN